MFQFCAGPTEYTVGPSRSHANKFIPLLRIIVLTLYLCLYYLFLSLTHTREGALESHRPHLLFYFFFFLEYLEGTVHKDVDDKTRILLNSHPYQPQPDCLQKNQNKQISIC